MINKSIKYIGVILLAYTLNACNEQRMSSSSETTTPVWLAEVGKRDVRELTTTTGTAKAAKTVEVKSETNGKYELMINPKTKRPYKLGDIVEEGAVIIKLNNKEHENTVSLPTKKMQVDIAKKEWDGQKAVFEKVATYKRKQHWKRHTRNWQNSQSKHPSREPSSAYPISPRTWRSHPVKRWSD